MLLRRMLIMIGVVVLVVLALGGYKGYTIYQQIQMFSAPKPAISVSASPVEELPWQQRIPAIGTLKAIQGVDLTVEVSGIVQDLLFNSGEQVKQGQALVQMNSDVETANLATAKADLDLARVEFARGKKLVAQQNLSKSEYDRLAAENAKANASVAQLEALLAKKRILAPFSGTIGIRQVDVGDFLSSGTYIATLQNTSQLYLDFFLPEQDVPEIALGQAIDFKVAAYPEQDFSATISAINPKVEDSTRNVQVRATLNNPDNKLLPGMFANLQLLLADNSAQKIVPETAVTYTLYGNSVYVVAEKKDEQGNLVKEEDGKPQLVAQRRVVETGERRDGKVIILKGLQAGEQVVTSGQLKLDNDAHIKIVDPSPAAASTPGAEQ
ncbi:MULTISPECIES: efflux RND transporter periplasmic adaptor subunit [Pseudomonas]|uniref:Membrane fusion protein, multidrug efflux system n=1 Tax=Pseudomonas segetis TaxID=298908 RepID=A0A239CUG1_9PSED|nr:MULTISPECIES: efflux RND transporter periplasmic adaptor subunit [Pseudomonas]SNS23589.1 membrane fusion protein, multidrug efflux system [Pseudomonas segetis]